MRRKTGLVTAAATAVVVALSARAEPAESDNWPQFRGPDGTAVVADDPGLPEAWSATDNIAWRTPIPGLGWSSPIVWGDRVFVTTVVADEDYEGPRAGLYLPAGRADVPPDPPPGTHHWLVLCLDLGSGDRLWQRTAHSGPMTATIHPKNSFASATPVTDGERVYALFGNLGLFAYDLDGRLVWSRDVEYHPDQWGWGAGSSPALLDDQVLVMHDNDEDSYLA
ncbi:MAG: PQQ-binding-like beta-propeller repeat protein, partial [Acidobacteria bacterium]|nr:PQQ-binding-like beta-propeller repeat protein [Acidobacteriota bacterium]